MMINLPLTLFFFILISSACNAQTDFKFLLLTKELSKKSIDIKYLNSTSRNITIRYPDIEDKLFSQMLNQLIIKRKNEIEDFCDEDEQAAVIISYEVKHLSSNLLSLIEKVNIDFCHHYPPSETLTGFNFLIKDCLLCPFHLSEFSKSELLKSLKIEDECVYYPEEVSFDLYIEQGTFYLLVWQDKICNYVTKIAIKEEMISFEEH